MDISVSFPSQKLPFKKKGKKWRMQCVDWAADRTYFRYYPVRTNVVHMKTNYDLVNGIVHMQDMAVCLNPGKLSTVLIPEKIQHYPIMNSKLNTLRGEEAARVFDWKVVVTNPNAITQIEEEKKNQFYALVRDTVENTELDNAQAQDILSKGKNDFEFNYQDLRELRGNELLKHYSKEQNFPQIFNDGFMDACIAAIEAYLCSIRGGEPVLQKLNPMKLHIYRKGYSDRLEDADVIVYEDYWSRGMILDTFYDEPEIQKNIDKLTEDLPEFGGSQPTGAAGNYDESFPFINKQNYIGEDGLSIGSDSLFGGIFDSLELADGGLGSDLMPYDVNGNIRVIQVWWKSLRKVLKVKSYDPLTGAEVYDFYPETYIPDASAGETAEELWVNQMWQGVKIGEDIYCAMRPCVVQHNSMSNPSRCHCGIVGTIYNLNESTPYSLVDMMKPYNYLYDACHEKLVELIAVNWGKLLEMDLALKPKKWKVEQWLHFARANKVLIKDSFNEGAKGAASGKLAGGLNNATKGYVDADWGNSIQYYIELLGWAKDSMSELVGINRQREGNTYNRETVGGIERAVMQSSYITDWLFKKHDDTKRRVLEAFLEYCKAAIRGNSISFQYKLSDSSVRLMTIPGDEFCECDYGLVVDNSNDTQKLYSQMEQLSQAALQNSYKLSVIAKMFSSSSLAEKMHLLEQAEKDMEAAQQQAAQQEQMIQQQKIEADLQAKQLEMQQKDMLNQRDNDTKIRVAELNAQAEYLRLGIYENENNEELRRDEMQIDIDKLKEDIREFDKELRFKEKELETKKEIEMKKIAAGKANTSTNKK